MPSVGPKTAVKWLQTYHSLENIIARASEITGKVGEKLRESLSFLPLSKELVTTFKRESKLSETPLTLHLNRLITINLSYF